MATAKMIGLILKALTDYYPGKFVLVSDEKGHGTAELWNLVLQDIPDNILQVATRQYMHDNIWPPSGAAGIIEIANKLMRPELPDAGKAWEECHLKCINGEHDNFSHPLIEQAYNRIGRNTWDALLTSEVMATRAHFLQIYKTLLEREENNLKMLPESKEVSEKYRIGVSELTKRLEL
jgi:hypothetical protein